MTSTASIKEYLRSTQILVDKALKRNLDDFYRKCSGLRLYDKAHKLIHKAMQYSVMAGGKRIRAILCLAGAEACGARAKDVLPCACGIEFIHTYSLIHDDLPAMDDDDWRRGKPSNHKMFGEATAILAGDALLTAGFELIAFNAKNKSVSPLRVVEVISLIARAAGWEGMVGGQVADLLCGNGSHNSRNAKLKLACIHKHKTGALIAASIESGCVLANASAKERAALVKYGEKIGLVFQITDDILDVQEKQKLTYPAVYGLEESRNMAGQLAESAKECLAPFGGKARPLAQLADYIVTRNR